MKFQPGDVVRLLAPAMTVEQVTNDEDVHCVWYEGAELRRGTFHVSSLTKTDTGDEAFGLTESHEPGHG